MLRFKLIIDGIRYRIIKYLQPSLERKIYAVFKMHLEKAISVLMKP